MPANKFLCGAFRDGAQVFDRETVNVLISSENEDNFVRNLLTILAESRLAFIVRRPQAFVYGTFP
jgi:HK97 family phage major capsid protein